MSAARKGVKAGSRRNFGRRYDSVGPLPKMSFNGDVIYERIPKRIVEEKKH